METGLETDLLAGHVASLEIPAVDLVLLLLVTVPELELEIQLS